MKLGLPCHQGHGCWLPPLEDILTFRIFTFLQNFCLRKVAVVDRKGLGACDTKEQGKHAGKPKAGKEIKVKPKKLPFFKFGEELKDRVDRYDA